MPVPVPVAGERAADSSAWRHTARCFAVGDSHNDMEMLDPAHAAMTACPSNAVPAIREHILATGGLVTRAAHGHGSVEALHHYFPS